MARFYFHLFDDVAAFDEEGTECLSAEAARDRAIRSARELAAAELLEGRLNLDHRIDVVDEHGAKVASVRFGDVVDVEGC